MASKPIYHSAEDIRSVLTWPLVIEAVEAALIAIGQTEPNQNDAEVAYVNQPERSKTLIDNQPDKLLFTMPGFVGNYQLGAKEEEAAQNGGRRNTLACKLITCFGENAERQPPLPNIMANILLFDTITGRLSAILDGTDITTWRTAAASVVATKYLYFRRFGADAEKDQVIDVGIVGCGVQGLIHALALCSNFKVANVYLWNRKMDKATELAHKLYAMEKVPNTYICSKPAEAVGNVDVVCIATNSPRALISLKHLNTKNRPLHINAIGAGQVHFGEVAQDIYDHADVYVDSMVSAESQLQNLRANIIGEVGEVITKAEYPEEKSLTIFQSMGIAAEDCCVAQAIHDALLAKDQDQPANI